MGDRKGGELANAADASEGADSSRHGRPTTDGESVSNGRRRSSYGVLHVRYQSVDVSAELDRLCLRPPRLRSVLQQGLVGSSGLEQEEGAARRGGAGGAALSGFEDDEELILMLLFMCVMSGRSSCK